METVILHSDLNACFASIECMLNPSLKGKPVAVAGNVENRHGIILAKSQEAKKFQVKTGEPVWKSKSKCPDLILVEPHYNEYLKYSQKVRDIYSRYTDLIEPFGIDEAWLDVSGSTKLFGSGEKIANEIRETVKFELGLTVSIGVSFNKIFAKLGSDLKKPDAVTVITRKGFKEKIWGLPASDMIGVGNATSTKLLKFGIRTIGDLATCEREWLVKLFGKGGNELWIFANGLDHSRVKPYGYQTVVKSVGHGITCSENLVDASEVWRVFLSLSQDINRRLNEYKLLASGVQIAIKDSTLCFKQYQKKLELPTQSATELAKAAIELFLTNYRWDYDVRAVTIRAIDLISDNTPAQINFFIDSSLHDRREKIDNAVLGIRKRFGDNIIFNACLMLEDKMPTGTPQKSVMPLRMFR